jgi:hypothetical protein
MMAPFLALGAVKGAFMYSRPMRLMVLLRLVMAFRDE